MNIGVLNGFGVGVPEPEDCLTERELQSRFLADMEKIRQEKLSPNYRITKGLCRGRTLLSRAMRLPAENIAGPRPSRVVLLQELLDLGADPNESPDRAVCNPTTHLFMAASVFGDSTENQAFVRLLLDYGAKRDVLNSNNQTASEKLRADAKIFQNGSATQTRASDGLALADLIDSHTGSNKKPHKVRKSASDEVEAAHVDSVLKIVLKIKPLEKELLS
jgi:hypothetical protein